MTILLIINYNDCDNTIRLINNVKDYSTIDKIIVVDNASTDDSYNRLNELKNIDLLLSDNNLGYSYAINIGLKYVNKNYKKSKIFISNSDIIIEKEKDIKLLVNSLKNDVGVVGPIINEHGNLNRGWKIPSPFIDAMMNLVLIHNYFRKKYVFYEEAHYTDKEVEVEVVSGCFFLVDGSVLEKINYFDSNVFLYYEENILAKKMQEIDKKEIINMGVTVLHDHAKSIDNNIKRIKKFKILKNSQYYFQTKYNKANIFEKFLLKFNKNISLMIYHIASLWH